MSRSRQPSWPSGSWRAVAAYVATAVVMATAAARPAASLTRFSDATGASPPAPWQLVKIPKVARPSTFRIESLDGERKLMAASTAAYANLAHPLDRRIDATPMLNWSWRVDRFAEGSDLSTKAGDDAAAKLCVLFDQPLEQLTVADSLKIRAARTLFDARLPTATLCYVWDRTLAPGTVLPNAYTDRVRFIVLRSAANGSRGRWFDERRDLVADFRLVFPGESGGSDWRLPPAIAVSVSSESDNTGGETLAWFGDIALEPR